MVQANTVPIPKYWFFFGQFVYKEDRLYKKLEWSKKNLYHKYMLK